MSKELSICIVGAGSSYTPELIDGLLAQPGDRLSVGSIRLTDINAERLGIMAGLTERMVRHGGRDVEVRSGTDLDEMLAGADFVVTQIRVGGMDARYLDESIPLKYGVIGQETTGPGGMCKALRTIEPMLAIARTVERVAPEAFVLNYTNPSGIVTEAVTRHTGARFVGLCSGMPAMQAELKRRLADAYPDVRSYCVGLNHLGFIHRILSGEKDVTVEAIERLSAEDANAATDNAEMALVRVARLLGAIPISYVLYYLTRGMRVAQARDADKTRAQQIMAWEEQIFAEAADPKTVGKPEALKHRGGGGYSDVTFATMAAIANDSGQEIAVSTPNRGAIDGIDDDAAVEVVCRVDRSGATPLPVGAIPLTFRGLVQAVKAYETLTVAAAVHRDRRLVNQALLNHPLVGDLDIIEPMMDEMLAAHGLDYQ